MLRHDRWITAALLVTALTATAAPDALLAADSVRPATAEAIPGSDLKRVILTAEAAKRIAVETMAIREEPVKRWLLVDGEVEAIPQEPAALAEPEAPAASALMPVRVRIPRQDDPDRAGRHTFVVLSLGEEEDDDDPSEKDDDKNDDDTADGSKILVLTIDGGSNAANASTTPLDEAEQAQYYEVSNADKRLTPGQRVQLKLAQPDSGKPQRVVPYSAVIYDLNGGTWVYGNPEPRVFVRQPVDIEYVHEDMAVLTDGPPAGTVIVSVGAAELMGVEQRVEK